MPFDVFGLFTGQDPNLGSTLHMLTRKMAFYFLFQVGFFQESVQTRFSSSLTKGGPIMVRGVP